MRKLLLLALLALLILPTIGFAEEPTCEVTMGKVEVFFFWREDCSHCHAETEFLKEMEQKFGDKLEVHYLLAKDNLELFYQMAKENNAPTQWLPATFIPCCNWHIIGFDEKVGEEIESKIKGQLEVPACDEDNYVLVPLIGKINIDEISLPTFTITLGLLDGFNPCAMFILMVLLSLLIHTKSRKKVAFIAGTFVFVSGLVYFMFMAVWLNVFMFMGFTGIVRIILALLALVVGIINIKDFFFFKKGISLSIPDTVKPKIFGKMRKIIQSDSVPTVLFGTIFLAFSVNLFEFLCTAGFPAIFTKVLVDQNLSPIMYYAYMLLYVLCYMIDDAIIVSIAVITLRSKKMTEGIGKWLKLISGLLMLGLAFAMIFAPELLMFT
jgi:thiol-disulfide isomerase/thioredoxin